MLHFECPSCRAELSVQKVSAWATLRCPRCEQTFRLRQTPHGGPPDDLTVVEAEPAEDSALAPASKSTKMPRAAKVVGLGLSLGFFVLGVMMLTRGARHTHRDATYGEGIPADDTGKAALVKGEWWNPTTRTQVWQSQRWQREGVLTLLPSEKMCSKGTWKIENGHLLWSIQPDVELSWELVRANDIELFLRDTGTGVVSRLVRQIRPGARLLKEADATIEKLLAGFWENQDDHSAMMLQGGTPAADKKSRSSVRLPQIYVVDWQGNLVAAGSWTVWHGRLIWSAERQADRKIPPDVPVNVAFPMDVLKLTESELVTRDIASGSEKRFVRTDAAKAAFLLGTWYNLRAGIFVTFERGGLSGGLTGGLTWSQRDRLATTGHWTVKQGWLFCSGEQWCDGSSSAAGFKFSAQIILLNDVEVVLRDAKGVESKLIRQFPRDDAVRMGFAGANPGIVQPDWPKQWDAGLVMVELEGRWDDPKRGTALVFQRRPWVFKILAKEGTVRAQGGWFVCNGRPTWFAEQHVDPKFPLHVQWPMEFVYVTKDKILIKDVASAIETEYIRHSRG